MFRLFLFSTDFPSSIIPLFPRYNISSKVSTRPISTSNFIYDTLFIDFDGLSPIFYSKAAFIQIAIVECSFYNCQSDIHGGAIFLDLTSGHFVLEKVCAYKCCTNSNREGQFIYNRFNTYSSNTSLTLVSMISCGTTTGKHTCCFYKTGLSFLNCNSSSNIAFVDSGFLLDTFNYISVFYSSFFGNYANSSRCIHLMHPMVGGTHNKIQYSNFLLCNGGTNGVITILANTLQLIYIHYCNFNQNSDYLFYMYYSTSTIPSHTNNLLIIEFSYIQHNSVSQTFTLNTNGGYYYGIQITSLSTNISTYAISQYNGDNCNPYKTFTVPPATICSISNANNVLPLFTSIISMIFTLLWFE